jgi:hypothetical protein
MKRPIYETRPPTEARPYPNSGNDLQQLQLYDTPCALQVEVLRLKPVNRGNLKAFVDVSLSLPEGKWLIRDCRIIQQPEQRPYVSLPQKEYHDRLGNLCYVPLVSPPEPIRTAICEAILKAWEVYLHG